MTAHEKILTAAEVDTLAKWVVQMNETGGQGGSAEGWALFKAKGCTACHGEGLTASWRSCRTGRSSPSVPPT